MSTTPSTYMSLPVPGVGNEAGPNWASDLNASLTILDMHDHTPGLGVPITPSGMDINAALTFANNQLTNAQFLGMYLQTNNPSTLGVLYYKGVDLYFNDGSGNHIQMTSSGGVAGSPGSIGSLTAPASATYSAGSTKFIWQSDTNKAASMDSGALIVRETGVASANATTIQSATSLAANYTLTLPTALPASTKYMSSTSGGALGFASADDIAAAMTTTGTASIFTTGVTWTNFTPTIVKDSGAGTYNSSTTTTARYVQLGKLVIIEMNIVSINISGGSASLKFTSPVTIAKEVKIPIWTQTVLTSAIGRLTSAAASTVIKIGSGIDGGGFGAGTTSEFSFTAVLEVN